MNIQWIKWKLMLTTLPITLSILLLKYVIVEVLNYEGLVKFSEISLVITGGIFLLGFMLAGTMTDYKESEKIPAELACVLESIEDTIALGYSVKPVFNLHDLKNKLHEATDTIILWFGNSELEQTVFTKINEIGIITGTLEKAGMGPIASRITGEQHNLRKLITRVNVIKKTGFLASGYAFLEVLTVIIIGLLLISKFENFVSSVIITSFVTQIFIYMVRLIKDIDQPFEYSSSGIKGAAEVDLFPIYDYSRRAKTRLASEIS
ncbi:MAG: hypothetical protein M3Q56_08990 [Bacteroidota bacterium]|nr:hypothetical protein [Bacteroidota bacterium]